MLGTSRIQGIIGDATAAATTMIPPASLVLLLALSTVMPFARAQISVAPSGAPAPALDCRAALLNLTPCLTYVERRSALTRPDKGCCGALAGVVGGDDAACFCGLVAGYGAHGVLVDPARALALPTICRVAAPPPKLCAALGMPVAEPPGDPAAAPAETGSDAPTTTPEASAASGGPATAQRHSSSYVYLPHCVILSALLLLLL